LLRDLANLAITLRNDGQVNPLTVVDASQGVSRLYRIETGERRYWATWLMRDFFSGYEGDGSIPCIIIPSGKTSVFRQARENTARSGLSAVALARQAALLILAVHGIEKPDTAVANDYYRQALQLDLRSRREYSADILASMGGISRWQFSRIKALIALSDEAMELADRHNLDEGYLRYVLALPTDDQAEMVRQIVQFGLTVRQVKELCESNESPPQTDPFEKPSKLALQFAKLMRTETPPTARELAKLLMNYDKDRDLVRARIQVTRKLLDEIEKYLQ
jgi:ParB-like chromosome segregation protein Spo0J